jgi:DNA-binding NarL/FixJ family response regulator
VKERSTLCRVFVCDDQAELRGALAHILDSLPGFEMVGEAIDGASCVEGLRRTRPDVLILDVSMPGGGAGLARAAKELDGALRIVVFSAHSQADLQTTMRAAGADEYVVKTGRVQALRDALHRAAAASALPELCPGHIAAVPS